MDDAQSDDELARYLEAVTVGPLEHTHVKVCEYDREWPRRFAREAARIHEALDGRERRIEHIGSTAVPGLAAKPIVDILLVVDDPADEASYLPALEAAGYALRVREPDLDQHRMLRTQERDVHVHVFPPHSAEIDRYLLLRDHLRTDEGDRDLYAATKRRLAQRDWLTMQHYAEAKTEVIEAILLRATAARAAAGAAGAGDAGAGTA